jgi:hypothetical protein
MIKQIFANLPVKDLKKSMDFFTALGFTFNKQFTDDKAACLVLGENIYSMLLVEKFFQSFIGKKVINSSRYSEVINALSMESREKVDELFDKAIASGARKFRQEDLGWMYSQGFEDLDGHLWEVFWMDPHKIEKT